LSVARNGPGADRNQREDIAVPAGTYIFISVVAIHNNRKWDLCALDARLNFDKTTATYWPEPEEFRPARFSGPYNKDAFVAFSTGRRTCIGQKYVRLA
jgi:hypothetical protein